MQRNIEHTYQQFAAHVARSRKMSVEAVNAIGGGRVWTGAQARANGLVCEDCEMSFPDKIKLSKQAADCFANFRQIVRAQESTLNEIERILVHHFTNILGHSLKMAKYIVK